VVAVLCGFPFQLLAYLFSMPHRRHGETRLYSFSWRRLVCYLPGRAVLRAVALIPSLRYKDNPVWRALPSREKMHTALSSQLKLRSLKQTRSWRAERNRGKAPLNYIL